MDNSDVYEDELNRLQEKENEQKRLNKKIYDEQIVPELQSMLHGNTIDWNAWGYPMHNKEQNTDPQNTLFKWQDLLNNNKYL